MPLAMATSSSPSMARTLRPMIGVWAAPSPRSWLRMAAVAWNPSMFGIWQSMTMASKSPSASASTAPATVAHDDHLEAEILEEALGQEPAEPVVVDDKDSAGHGNVLRSVAVG